MKILKILEIEENGDFYPEFWNTLTTKVQHFSEALQLPNGMVFFSLLQFQYFLHFQIAGTATILFKYTKITEK